jgi:hypothetical protein
MSQDTPLVRDYLECFREIVRLVVEDQDVPDAHWQRIRDTWAAMSLDERAEAERRTPKGPRGTP